MKSSVGRNHMKKIRTILIEWLITKIRLYTFLEFLAWFKRDFSQQATFYVKKKVLKRNSNGKYWIETGTYYGSMTRYLAEISDYVHTIEPSTNLFLKAKKRSKYFNNIVFHNGSSEEKLRGVILDISTKTNEINFWLDGHYSYGETFLGEKQTPIIYELKVISELNGLFPSISIFVDDVRSFVNNFDMYSDYPDLDYLVNWARSNNFKWKIEHDIFIMNKK